MHALNLMYFKIKILGTYIVIKQHGCVEHNMVLHGGGLGGSSLHIQC